MFDSPVVYLKGMEHHSSGAIGKALHVFDMYFTHKQNTAINKALYHSPTLSRISLITKTTSEKWFFDTHSGGEGESL